MARAPSGTIFAPCQKHVSDRQFERAEAQDFAALIAHGIAESRGRTCTGDSSCCPPGGTASDSNLNQG